MMQPMQQSNKIIPQSTVVKGTGYGTGSKVKDGCYGGGMHTPNAF